MADIGLEAPLPGRGGGARLTRLFANPKFQAWAARFPLTRRRVRREGEAMFDIVAGFCHSQILQALVAFRIPQNLLDGPLSPAAIATACGAPLPRIEVLLNGAISLGLLKRKRGLIGLTVRGAALAGVPGLADMIRHHAVLYRDLADPVAFFRGETQTELADFWPYVFGAGAAQDPETAERYSRLMTDSQGIVAADTLATVSLTGITHLMDVGGGTGAFLSAVAARAPGIALTLHDLPAVTQAAERRLAGLGLGGRITLSPGSFRDAPLPKGADAISLIRVLYDHDDTTVVALLRAVHAALPPGGRLIISEPMTGGDRPARAGDAYFALYCMAMRTGKARAPSEIAALAREAGFDVSVEGAGPRPFVTSVVEAVRKS